LFNISISLTTLRAKLIAQLSLLTPSDRHEGMSDRPLVQNPDVYIFNLQIGKPKIHTGSQHGAASIFLPTCEYFNFTYTASDRLCSSAVHI